MTCIVGYKHDSGEIILSADNRLTWDLRPPHKVFVHVDNLQKIYFPLPNVAVAFAGKDVGKVRYVLARLRNELPTLDTLDCIDARSAYDMQQSVKRLLEWEAVIPRTDSQMLVALVFPGREDLNRLFYCENLKGSAKPAVEVQAGKFKVAGSVFSEDRSEEFISRVIKQAFSPNPLLPVSTRIDLFNGAYAGFAKSLPRDWLKVGQFFCTVHSDDGEFARVAYDTELYCAGSSSLSFGVDFDELTERFVLKNHQTGKIFPLVHLDDYNLHRIPLISSKFLAIPY